MRILKSLCSLKEECELICLVTLLCVIEVVREESHCFCKLQPTKH